MICTAVGISKLHLENDTHPSSVVVVKLQVPVVGMWRHKAVHAQDLHVPYFIVILNSAWSHTSLRTFGRSSNRSQAIAGLSEVGVLRDGSASFIVFMLSLLPV